MKYRRYKTLRGANHYKRKLEAQYPLKDFVVLVDENFTYSVGLVLNDGRIALCS